MLSCKDISHLASEHIDNNLSFSMKMKVKMHLFVCHRCRAFMNQFRITVETVKNITPVETNKNTVDQQVEALIKANHNIQRDIKPDNIDR